MSLNFGEAREYLLSQPFVEDSGDSNTLLLNVHALPRKSMPQGEVQSNFGEAITELLKERLLDSPHLGSIFNRPDGAFRLDLDHPPHDMDYARLGSASLELVEGLEYLFRNHEFLFSETTEKPINPKIIQQIYMDSRLRRQVASDLAKKYGLILPKHRSAVIVSTRELNEMSELDNLLNLGHEYTRAVYTPEFLRESESLNRGINRQMVKISKRLRAK